MAWPHHSQARYGRAEADRFRGPFPGSGAWVRLRPTFVGGAVGEQKADLFVGSDRTGCGELTAYRVAHCFGRRGGLLGLSVVESRLVRRFVHLAMPHCTAFFLRELGQSCRALAVASVLISAGRIEDEPTVDASSASPGVALFGVGAVISAVHQVGQQRRLPDPRLPADHQRTTPGAAGLAQQHQEALLFPFPTV